MQKPINNTANISATNKKQWLSIMVSILLHVFIICALFVWLNPNKPLTNHNQVETSLVTPEQLQNIQNQQQASKLIQNTTVNNQQQTDIQAENIPNNIIFEEYTTHEPIPYETQTDVVQPEILSKTKPVEESIFTPSAQQADDYTTSNRTTPKENIQALNTETDMIKQSSTQAINTVQQPAMSQQTNAKLTTNTQNITTSTTTAGETSSNTLSAIKTKVSAYLPSANELPNAENDATLLTLTVDKNGYITNHKTKGDNNQLNEASIDAAYKAQPLPIGVNNPKTYPIIVIQLNGKTLN